MSAIGNLQGFKVRLREIRKSTDFARCLEWVNDSEVTRFTKLNPPISEQEEEAWFAGLATRANEKVFAIETLTGEHIGNVGLLAIDHQQGLANSGTLIGDKRSWGQGYGTDAKMILLDYAFHTLGLRRIKSVALAFNERSIRMNLRCGYRQEGLWRQERFKNGCYWDEVLLGILKDEWEPIWERYRATGSLK